MSGYNHTCARCGRRGFYSPDYLENNVLCLQCNSERLNWFWRLLNRLNGVPNNQDLAQLNKGAE